MAPAITQLLIIGVHMDWKVLSLFLFGLSTGNILADWDSDDESEWSEMVEESAEEYSS